ncbi:unnamed protein product [Eretmochelys imbricata]
MCLPFIFLFSLDVLTYIGPESMSIEVNGVSIPRDELSKCFKKRLLQKISSLTCSNPHLLGEKVLVNMMDHEAGQSFCKVFKYTCPSMSFVSSYGKDLLFRNIVGAL